MTKGGDTRDDVRVPDGDLGAEIREGEAGASELCTFQLLTTPTSMRMGIVY